MALLKIKDEQGNWHRIAANILGSPIEGKSVVGGTFTVSQSYYSSGGAQTVNHTLGAVPTRLVVFAKDSAGAVNDNWTWIINEYQNFLLRGTGSYTQNMVAATSGTFTITFPSLQFNPTGTYYWLAMN